MRSPSGPRWASAAAMADMQSGCLSGTPESETAPKMPHTTAPFHPAGEVVEVGEVVRFARPVRRVVVVRGEERQRGAEGGAHLALPRARQEHRGHGAARQRLAPIPRGKER